MPMDDLEYAKECAKYERVIFPIENYKYILKYIRHILILFWSFGFRPNLPTIKRHLACTCYTQSYT